MAANLLWTSSKLKCSVPILENSEEYWYLLLKKFVFQKEVLANWKKKTKCSVESSRDNASSQEIIKVREWIPHIGPLAKVIRLKLFLDIVPSSFADITRALRGCFRVGLVYVSFRFVLKQSKTSNSVKMCSLKFWLQAKELRLSVCCNTFRNFKGSLNKRRMYPAQTITIEWTAEKCLDKWQTTSKPPNTTATQPNKQLVESVVRRLLPKWQKAAWAATVTTLKTTSIKKRLDIQPTNLARSWIHSVCLSI